MTGLLLKLGLNSEDIVSGLTSATDALGAFNDRLGAMVGLDAGLISIEGAFAGIGKAIKEAAAVEGFEPMFERLLGSADLARARVQELAKFVTSTPFDLPEVVQASRTLEKLTQGALSTGAGLRLVGDVAAGTQQPFGEIASTVGELYSGLQNGQSAGVAIESLRKLGAISDGTAARLGQMQAEGLKGNAVWQVAAASMGKFSGEMARQSGTWNGLMSRLQKSVNAVFREFGTPVMDSLKPMLTAAIGMAETLAPLAKQLGESFANAINVARHLFESGQLGKALSLSLQIGFGEAVNFGIGLFRGLLAALGTMLASSGTTLVKTIGVVLTPSFWGSLGEILIGAAQGFGAVMADVIGNVLLGISKIKMFGWLKGPADLLRNSAAKGGEIAKDFLKTGFRDLAADALPVTEHLEQVGKDALAGGMEAAKGTNVINTLGERVKLKRLFTLPTPEPKEGPGNTSPVKSAPNAKPGANAGPQAGGYGSLSVPLFPESFLSEGFSKIGSFIGDAGGPQGQKSNEETAKNTGLLVKEQQRMNANFEKQYQGSTATQF